MRGQPCEPLVNAVTLPVSRAQLKTASRQSRRLVPFNPVGSSQTVFEQARPKTIDTAMAYTLTMITQAIESRTFSQNPKDPVFYNDPYAFYSKLHKLGGPIYWQDYDLWCLSEFDAVNNALRDSRFARLPPAGFAKPEHPAHLSDFSKVEEYSLLALEPPHHTRIRKSVNQAFMNRRIVEMEAGMVTLAHELIDRFEGDGQTDLLRTYAMQLPVTVIARLLGVPETQTEALLDWSHAMVRVYTLTQTHEEEIEANKAASDFRDLLLELIGQRRAQPQDDLLSHLVLLQPDALSDDEIVSTAVLLLNAGHEATVHQIGNAVKVLLETDNDRSWIDNDKQTDNIVAEAMRYDAPLHLFTRFAQEDIDLHPGVIVEKGQEVALLLGAANRDPGRFNNANQFLPDRSDGATVAFGAGLHFCVGAILAKLEMRVAINTLFKRLPNLHLGTQPEYANSFHFHGLESLQLRW